MEAIVPLIQCFLSGIFFIIFVVMVKDFAAKMCSIGFADYLSRMASSEIREKLCRWFVNKDVLLEELKSINQKLGK